MDPLPRPVVALNEQTVPSVSSFTPSVTLTEVILATPGQGAPALPGLSTTTVPFRDTATGSPALLTRRLRYSGSGRVPSESLDAPEDRPKEASRQVALGKLEYVVPHAGSDVHRSR